MESTIVKLEKIGFVSCDVRDLAPLLPAEARRLRWRLMEGYEGVEVLMTVDSYQRSVGSFPRTPMDYRWMLVWWTRQFQSVWATYIATEDDSVFDHFSGEYLDWIAPKLLLGFPFALQAVDNSWWLVHSTDEAFLTRLERDFGAERMPYRPR